MASSPAQAERTTLTAGWSFHEGDVKGAQAKSFDDSGWGKVSAPHDWSIGDGPDGKPRFDPKTPSGADSGYLPGGVGWYRRTIDLDAKAAAGTVLLTFESAYMDSEIWLNGVSVGRHHYGYSAFTLDLTGKVRPGRNVIAVRLDHEDPSSRWYAGSGLIRPVQLDLLATVHLDPEGPVVTTPVANRGEGRVTIRSAIANRSSGAIKGMLETRIVSPSGQVVHRVDQPVTIPAGGTVTPDRSVRIARPALWSPGAPALYRLEERLSIAGRAVDTRSTRFGIRTITVDATHGLRINGTRVLLRGGNIHHDNYMLGAAGWPRADARKVELMKAAGYNAIRSAHNPASQALLDAADRLGMLVIDEAFDAWSVSKRDKDYARFYAADWRKDLRSMVVRARNHPSVIMWSIGNEIPEQNNATGWREGAEMAAEVRRLDPTRPVTQAISEDGTRVDGAFANLDVSGYNYRAHLYGTDHLRMPKRVMYGSESFPADAYNSWAPTATMPWAIGDFVWTAIDYLGEASIGWTGYSHDWKKIGPYPWHLAYCGEIDATGRRLPGSYYRQMIWTPATPAVAAFVRWPEPGGSLPDRDIHKGGHPEWVMPDLHQSWSWKGWEGKPLDVTVYSTLPEVELLLNGRSIGRKRIAPADRYTASFAVPYAPGKLVARGYRNGRVAAEWTLQSAGEPVAIRVSADRATIAADGEDLVYVTADLVDAEGHAVYAHADDRLLTVSVAGAAVLAGVGNGNPVGTESFTSGRRSSFRGHLVAVVRAGSTPGATTVRVAGEGLRSGEVRVGMAAR